MIQLIVGLGNPGAAYAGTRHNAGAWFVRALAEQYRLDLRREQKFHGLSGELSQDGQRCHVLIPTTFMNESGQAVRAVSTYYHLPPDALLIAHDDLDFPPGVARFKKDGGHGGHNGLCDIIDRLHSRQFYRLRIGIGHPGHKDLVHDYVLGTPPRAERAQMETAIDHALAALPALLAGDIEKATQHLHTHERNG